MVSGLLRSSLDDGVEWDGPGSDRGFGTGIVLGYTPSSMRRCCCPGRIRGTFCADGQAVCSLF